MAEIRAYVSTKFYSCRCGSKIRVHTCGVIVLLTWANMISAFFCFSFRGQALVQL